MITDKFKKYYLLSFRIGLFLLPSAPFFAVIFFLISLMKSLLTVNLDSIRKDNYNLIFFVSIIGMFFISIFHYINLENLILGYEDLSNNNLLENKLNLNINKFSSFIGLFNWIPFFFCFLGFQKYLSSIKDREITSKILVTGSVPVLVSGFGQYFFDWHGQMELFNGLVIWFQKPNDHLAGLFSNQNYTGCWLNIIWPFSIAILFEKAKGFVSKSSSLIFIFSIFIASLLTSSRNAWGGLFLTLPLLIGPISLRLFLPFSIIIITIIILNSLNNIPENINEIFNAILPSKLNIFNKFSSSFYPDYLDKRITIVTFALNQIIKNPFLGYGASTFPIYYLIKHNVFKGHTHNLFVDLAFNYGLIIALLIFSNILIICTSSFKKVFISNNKNIFNNFFERAWWTSFFVLLISQMFDVQYYDLRISIVFWILISGLKCISDENKENKLDFANK